MTACWQLILNGKSYDDSCVDNPIRTAVTRLRAGEAIFAGGSDPGGSDLSRTVAGGADTVDIAVRVTSEDGDVAHMVSEAVAADVDCIVAGGGDGTLSAVASAMATYDADAVALPALALLPMGTANDFAQAAGIPVDPAAALQGIRDHPARPIDLLRVQTGAHTHWCVNLASGGFGTGVTVETNTGMKHMLGGLAYLVTGIAALGRIETAHARLHGPDFDWQGDFIALGIGNGRQAGGGQPLCPDARIDDGLLDLTVIPDLGGELGTTVARLVTEGKRAALEQVATRARLPWIEVESTRPLTLNLDGEPVESRFFRIDCVPGRLRMHLPRDCPLLVDTATVGA